MDTLQLSDGRLFLMRPRLGKIYLNPKAFKKMKRLRILIVTEGDFSCSPDHLPSELRWLEWHRYPSSSLPSNFSPSNLVALILPCSGITKLWDGYKMGSNLTTINISRCSSLCEVPDFSGMPKFKELIAHRCTSLVKVHKSIGYLAKLVHLNFQDCSNLAELRNKLRLPSLRQLVLSGCERLDKFPDILGRMEHIEAIDLSWTSVKQLPPSIKSLTEVQSLCFAFCRNLEALPTSIYHFQNLKHLNISHCKRHIGFLGKGENRSQQKPGLNSHETPIYFPNTVQLDLSENSLTALLPCISKFCDLKTPFSDKSKQLKDIPELPPNLTYLSGKDCESLEMVQTVSLQVARTIKINFSNSHKLGQIKLQVCCCRIGKGPSNQDEVVSLGQVILSQHTFTTCICVGSSTHMKTLSSVITAPGCLYSNPIRTRPKSASL
ncbi:disease resistance protein LAZ5-like [Punica granatum]|uniref:Disease resistance protein LAZ5-like n=1 Tax=Punica granatum TaxID=22663 RepID=A0A6P8EF27_PUNGR|nr:disease resistance protein LAZ5-like [Punica granatum]